MIAISLITEDDTYDRTCVRDVRARVSIAPIHSWRIILNGRCNSLSVLLVGDYSAPMFMIASLLSHIDRTLIISHTACMDTACKLIDELRPAPLVFLESDSIAHESEQTLQRLIQATIFDTQCVLVVAEAGMPRPLQSCCTDMRIVSTSSSVVDLSKSLREVVLALRRSSVPALSARRKRPEGISTPVDLTSRQRDVLELLQRGFSSKRIAAQLRLNRGTVDNHVTALMRTLGVANRGHAIAKAIEFGVLRTEPLQSRGAQAVAAYMQGDLPNEEHMLRSHAPPEATAAENAKSSNSAHDDNVST